MKAEKLVKIDEVERATGISRFKWYRLLKSRNDVPVYMCGRAMRFRVSELMAWMQAEPRWEPPKGKGHAGGRKPKAVAGPSPEKVARWEAMAV